MPLSLSKAPQIAGLGIFALIPAPWHASEPLRQRMVLLKGAGAEAADFYGDLQKPQAREILACYRFRLPVEAWDCRPSGDGLGLHHPLGRAGAVTLILLLPFDLGVGPRQRHREAGICRSGATCRVAPAPQEGLLDEAKPRLPITSRWTPRSRSRATISVASDP